MDKTYRVYFDTTNLGMHKILIPGIEEAMRDEFIRVYNIYANKTNSGITDELNESFERIYPNYFKKNKNKEWYELKEYNQFMADGYQSKVVDEFNKTNVSPLLDFYVDPEEVVFTGRLKVDPKVTIQFYMREV